MIHPIRDRKPNFGPDMTILGVISRCRQTEAVFHRYDEKAGVQLCRESLFDPLKDVAEKYSLNLEEILRACHGISYATAPQYFVRAEVSKHERGRSPFDTSW